MSIFHREGKLRILDKITAGYGFIIGLHTDSAPYPADVELNDITDVVYGGYSPQTFLFPTPSLNADGDAQTTAAPISFSGPSFGTVTIHGWYIQDADDDVLLFFQQYGTPVVIGVGQVPHVITPRLILGKCNN